MASPATNRRPESSLATRVAAGIGVVAATLAGLWIFAGLIAPSETLTVFGERIDLAVFVALAWFLVASWVVGRIWKRYPDLKWATRGPFLATALVAIVVFAWTSFRDETVEENVVTGVKASEASEPAAGGGGGQDGAGESSRNVEEAAGQFVETDHGPASGSAAIVRLAGGERKLTIQDLSVDNGPDLRVYLVPGDGTDVSDNRDIGGLKGNQGDQQYDIPADIDTERYRTVVIWCRAFSVSFARAPLEAQ